MHSTLSTEEVKKLFKDVVNKIEGLEDENKKHELKIQELEEENQTLKLRIEEVTREREEENKIMKLLSLELEKNTNLNSKILEFTHAREDENETMKLLNLELEKSGRLKSEILKITQEREEEIKAIILINCELEKNKTLNLTISDHIQETQRENETLKLQILNLSQELEKIKSSANSCQNSGCVEGQEEQEVYRPRKKFSRVMSESDSNNQQISVAVQTEQIEETLEKIGMIDSVMSVSSESECVTSFGGVRLKKERVDELISGSMDEDISEQIDIKEEDVGFKSKSNGNNSNDPDVPDQLVPDHQSDIAVKSEHEIDKRIQTRLFSPPNHTSNTEPAAEDFVMEIGPKEKEPYLRTLTAQKNHSCETCKETFDTRFKFIKHIKSHTFRKFKSVTAFTMANKEEQEKQNRKYDSRFCGFCSRSWRTVKWLTVHVDWVHVTKGHRHKCSHSECNNKSFATLSALTIHNEGKERALRQRQK